AEHRISTKSLALINLRTIHPVLFLDLSALFIRIQRILIAHFFYLFGGYFLLKHQVCRFGYAQGIAAAPVGGTVNKNTLCSILFDYFYHALVAHFGAGVDGKGSPVAAVQHIFDGFFVIMIYNNFSWVQVVFLAKIHTANGALLFIAVRGV